MTVTSLCVMFPVAEISLDDAPVPSSRGRNDKDEATPTTTTKSGRSRSLFNLQEAAVTTATGDKRRSGTHSYQMDTKSSMAKSSKGKDSEEEKKKGGLFKRGRLSAGLKNKFKSTPDLLAEGGSSESTTPTSSHTAEDVPGMKKSTSTGLLKAVSRRSMPATKEKKDPFRLSEPLKVPGKSSSAKSFHIPHSASDASVSHGVTSPDLMPPPATTFVPTVASRSSGVPLSSSVTSSSLDSSSSSELSLSQAKDILTAGKSILAPPRRKKDPERPHSSLSVPLKLDSMADSDSSQDRNKEGSPGGTDSSTLPRRSRPQAQREGEPTSQTVSAATLPRRNRRSPNPTTSPTKRVTIAPNPFDFVDDIPERDTDRIAMEMPVRDRAMSPAQLLHNELEDLRRTVISQSEDLRRQTAKTNGTDATAISSTYPGSSVSMTTSTSPPSSDSTMTTPQRNNATYVVDSGALSARRPGSPGRMGRPHSPSPIKLNRCLSPISVGEPDEAGQAESDQARPFQGGRAHYGNRHLPATESGLDSILGHLRFSRKDESGISSVVSSTTVERPDRLVIYTTASVSSTSTATVSQTPPNITDPTVTTTTATPTTPTSLHSPSKFSVNRGAVAARWHRAQQQRDQRVARQLPLSPGSSNSPRSTPSRESSLDTTPSTGSRESSTEPEMNTYSKPQNPELNSPGKENWSRTDQAPESETTLTSSAVSDRQER